MTYPTSDILETEVDNVDDVMAQHVNELRGASVNMNLRHVKNTSGAAVAVGDVGGLSYAGEFKTTVAAYVDMAWAVVVVGGANNADIVVAVGGSKIVVTCNGNAAVGDFLYTSTTVGQARPLSTMRPEMFAIVTKANAAGAGGTCEALLHCNSRFVPLVSAVDIHSTSGYTLNADWRTTINGAPAGAVVTYTVPLTSGAEGDIVPTMATAYGKTRLYNETRADYALIDSVNIGADQITLTANAPAGWANLDVITVRSQTIIDPVPPPYFFDVDLSSADNTAIPVLARTLYIDVSTNDTAAANYGNYIHEWSAYGTSKIKATSNYNANQITARGIEIALIQRGFAIQLRASGAGTGISNLRLRGYDLAVP